MVAEGYVDCCLPNTLDNLGFLDRMGSGTISILIMLTISSTKNLWASVLVFEKLPIMKENAKENGVSKDISIVIAKDINEKCYALKPENYLSPALKPGSKDYKLRGLIRLSKLPKGVSCEKE